MLIAPGAPTANDRRARHQNQMLFTLVFGLGAALAGLAGLMQHRSSRADRQGENILISPRLIVIAASARSAARSWPRSSSA